MTFVIFVLVMSVLVIVHEFGHFIAARKNGVKVDEFGLGFPPRLFAFAGKATTYTINLVPLGGFVKIKGETGEARHAPDSYANKKPWQKALILAGGVIMNLLTAWVFLSIALLIGVPVSLDDNTGLPKSARMSDIAIRVDGILKDSPASKVDMKVGDVVEAINGQKIETVKEIQQYVNEWGQQPLNVTLRRGQESISVTAVPEKIQDLDRFALGVGLTKSAIISYPPVNAAWEGLKRTGIVVGRVVEAFYKIIATLLTGQKPDAEISGPVAIAVVTGEVAQLGLAYILQFMAILSVNLAVINILPFPALDGGRLLFLAIGKIRGKPVREDLEIMTHNIGFTFLIILMIFVTISDIGKYGGAFWSSLGKLF